MTYYKMVDWKSIRKKAKMGLPVIIPHSSKPIKDKT